MNLEFAPRIGVFSGEAKIYDTHADDAARLLRDGLARRRCKGRKVRALDLVTIDIDCSRRAPGRGNPQKYTYLEALGEMQPCDCGGERTCLKCHGHGSVPVIDAHCQSLKPHVTADEDKNWPIFRATLVSCLPRDRQARIRELFAPKKDRRAA